MFRPYQSTFISLKTSENIVPPMKIEILNENFSVASQIITRDLTEIKNLGYKTVICNRPNSEEGATPSEIIEQEAKDIGLDFVNLPVLSGCLTSQNAIDMVEIIIKSKKPILAYCRSGSRSKELFKLCNEQQKREKN